jgi:hypothetical protein
MGQTSIIKQLNCWKLLRDTLCYTFRAYWLNINLSYGQSSTSFLPYFLLRCTVYGSFSSNAIEGFEIDNSTVKL